MPHNPSEEGPSREEPGNPIPPESADEQDQDCPRGYEGKAFLEHLEDSMNEHETLGRLLVQSERPHLESRTQGLPEYLPGRLDKGDQPGRRRCRGT